MIPSILAALLLAPSPVETAAAKLIADNKTPGIVVYAKIKGKETVSLALGDADREAGRKMAMNSVHELASVSKQFTAAAIMKLVDQKKLSLDSTLASFVPDAPEAWKKVTIRHLIHHTSGLPDYLAPTVDIKKDTTVEELVLSLRGLKMDAEPGKEFAYSNSGYMALGYIIEKVSKRSLTDFVAREIFRPAGMKTATGAHPDTKIANRAVGYSRAFGKWVPEIRVSPGFSALGDGFVMASARDLVAWHDAMRTGKILSKSSWEFMTTPNPEIKDAPYGGGLAIGRPWPEPRVSHSGGWIGTSTFLMSDFRDNSVLIVLCNAEGVDFRPVVDELFKLMN